MFSGIRRDDHSWVHYASSDATWIMILRVWTFKPHDLIRTLFRSGYGL